MGWAAGCPLPSTAIAVGGGYIPFSCLRLGWAVGIFLSLDCDCGGRRVCSLPLTAIGAGGG
eukprot:1194526-Prorocentrum_minimum.AAC.4